MTGGISAQNGSAVRFPVVPAALSHLLAPGLGLARQNGLPGLSLGLPGVGIPPPIAALAQTVQSAAANTVTTSSANQTSVPGFPPINVSTV